MKVGDTVPVQIGAATVANAKIVELGDGTATLVIPATKVIMGVRTQLDTAPTPTGGTEHAILGVENQPTTNVEPNVTGVDNPITGAAELVETPAGGDNTADSTNPVEAAPVAPAAPVENAPTNDD